METKQQKIINRMDELKDLISQRQIDEEDARFEITNLVDNLSENEEEREALMKIVRENQF